MRKPGANNRNQRRKGKARKGRGRGQRPELSLTTAKGNPKIELYEKDKLPDDEAAIIGLSLRRSKRSIAAKLGWSLTKMLNFSKQPIVKQQVAELRLEFLNRVKEEVIKLGRIGLRDLKELAQTTEDDKVRFQCSNALASLLSEMLKSEGLLGEVKDLSGRLESAEYGSIKPEELDTETVMKIIQETSFTRRTVVHGSDTKEDDLHGRDVAEGGPAVVIETQRSDVDSPVREPPNGAGGLDAADPDQRPSETGEEFLPAADMLGEMS